MADSRNQRPENSKIPLHESESLKENVNQCMGAFYLSHHELVMNEFGRVLNEKCTGCQTNDHNQFGHELCSPHITSVQYCRGCSVLWGITSVHVRGSISTVEAVQYCERIASVLWGIASALQRNSIYTTKAVQYCGGIAAVHVGDSISTVEAIQYCGGIAAVLQRDIISKCGG